MEGFTLFARQKATASRGNQNPSLDRAILNWTAQYPRFAAILQARSRQEHELMVHAVELLSASGRLPHSTSPAQKMLPASEEEDRARDRETIIEGYYLRRRLVPGLSAADYDAYSRNQLLWSSLHPAMEAQLSNLSPEATAICESRYLERCRQGLSFPPIQKPVASYDPFLPTGTRRPAPPSAPRYLIRRPL